jgi:tetratricopeptide (TPR) repeat protein
MRFTPGSCREQARARYPRAMRRAVCLVLLALATEAAADATDKLVEEAAKLYEQADLAGALAKLEKAYARSKRPDVLFGIARIHVDRGNCAKAIEVYREYLESKPKPGPRSTQIATEKIAECQKVIAATTPAPAEPVEPAPVAEPEPKAELDRVVPTKTIERAWYTDVVGDVLVLGGLAGLATGGWFYMGARDDVDAANGGGAGGVTAAEYISLRDRAERRHLYAAIGAGVGGALLVGGILKFSLGDRTEVVPAPGGVALRGSF